MNIQKINSDANFKSGSTFKLIKKIYTMDVRGVEKDFFARGIKTDFSDNKSVCADFVFALDIFEKLAEKYKLPFSYLPSAIQVYKTKDLIFTEDKDNLAMHVREKAKYIKNKPAFKEGAILINEDYNKNHFQNEYFSSVRGFYKIYSTWHFLHITLHELMHNMEMHQIYKQNGYRGLDKDLRKKYHKEFTPNLGAVLDEVYEPMIFTRKEKIFLDNKVGLYALHLKRWNEIYAELMTKMVVKSLDNNLIPVKNPMDNLPKDCPERFKKQLEETLNI